MLRCHTYWEIFNEEFNISFFTPKKDKCKLCEKYKLSEGSQKDARAKNMTVTNKKMKKKSTRKKNYRTKISDLFIVACYDLQTVMTVPNGQVSNFYFFNLK